MPYLSLVAAKSELLTSVSFRKIKKKIFICTCDNFSSVGRILYVRLNENDLKICRF